MRLRTRLEMGSLHQKNSGLAVCLEVDPGDEILTKQKRQYVISVSAFLLGHVNLDPIVETEEPLGTVPIPDH